MPSSTSDAASLKEADVSALDLEGLPPSYEGNDDGRPRLSARHLQFISIAGMIGTGLFLSSGSALSTAGPLGALLGYMLMGVITAAVSVTAGEMSSFMPVSAGFVRHATKFVGPAVGAATGFNFWYSIAIQIGVEVTASAILISYWNADINNAVWITILLIPIFILNLVDVRFFGEAEFGFAALKILLVIILIIGGLVVDLGGGPNGDRIGFRFWNDPGAMNSYLVPGASGRFLGFWSTLTNAAFAYGNVQIVAIAGAETSDPRRAIPKAVRRTWVRVVLFYVLSILIVGMIVRSDDPNLNDGSGTATQSPFVVAFNRAGITGFAHFVNAVVLTSAFSSGNSCLFISSRTLVGLAVDGLAPKLFTRRNRFGSPWVAVCGSAWLGLFAYMSLQSTAFEVFNWLINLSAIASLISWAILCFTYLRFHRGLTVQGLSRNDLPYKSPLQPYTAFFGFFMCIVITFFSGFAVFFPDNWSASAFFSNYLNVFVIIVLFAIAKFAIWWSDGFIRTRNWLGMWSFAGVIPAREMDFSEFEAIRKENESRVEKPLRGWTRLWDLI